MFYLVINKSLLRFVLDPKITSSLAPPSCPNMLIGGSKRRRWLWPKKPNSEIAVTNVESLNNKSGLFVIPWIKMYTVHAENIPCTSVSFKHTMKTKKNWENEEFRFTSFGFCCLKVRDNVKGFAVILSPQLLLATLNPDACLCLSSLLLGGRRAKDSVRVSGH